MKYRSNPKSSLMRGSIYTSLILAFIVGSYQTCDGAFVVNPSFNHHTPSISSHSHVSSFRSNDYANVNANPSSLDRISLSSMNHSPSLKMTIHNQTPLLKKTSKSKSWKQHGKDILSTTVVSMVFLLWSFVNPPLDQVAFAADDSIGDPSTSTSTSTTTVVPITSNNPSPPPTPVKEAEEPTDPNIVLDEVWTLISKYYIDRSFHNQNWSQVLSDYHSKISSSSISSTDNKSLMKLTTQMVSSLDDKYSRMLEPDAYQNIQKFDLIGVGATFMPDNAKRIIVGAPPIPGSAADLAGMKFGDYIDAVNGVKTEGRTAFDITDQVGEDPNAKEVTMTVRRQSANDLPGEGETRDVVLQRSFTQVNDPIRYKLTERRQDGTVVGYVRINEFNSLVKRQLEKALADLERQGANAYVLDLRGNPGGAFQSAVEIGSYFMDDTVSTFVVDNNDVELPFKTAKGKVLIDESDPISVWVDRRSASASEVLAGSLKDNCRGVVMGKKSFGKGLIQAVYGLKNGAGLVLTVARYVTPNGTDIQGTGINPQLTAGVPASIIPGVTLINGDTSKIDFDAVREQRNMCLASTSK